MFFLIIVYVKRKTDSHSVGIIKFSIERIIIIIIIEILGEKKSTIIPGVSGIDDARNLK